jgi:formate dehydrogenase maturation protein FdhE
MFKCVNCGNNDPTLMGFLKFKGQEGFELNFCEACNHYIKIIDEDLPIRNIPYGLEDLLTRELDNIATNSDLNLRRI